MSDALYPSRPVLVVDDDRAVLEVISLTLESKGISNYRLCEDSREVIQILRDQPVEVVLLDLVMPHVDGRELLAQLTELYPDIPTIVITALDEVTTAVDCMRSQAYDYLVKPVDSNRLVSSIRRAVEYGQLQRENQRLVDYMSSFTLRNPSHFESIVTTNDTMLGLFAQIESIADSSAPVLFAGETGVGKETLARSLYTASGRVGRFIPVSVANAGEKEFMRLLFGGDTPEGGLVQEAAGGMLYLDEISSTTSNQSVFCAERAVLYQAQQSELRGGVQA